VGRKTRGAQSKPRARGAPAAAPATASEVEALRRELAEVRGQLGSLTRDGVEAYTRRRLAELEEARGIARGQALEAAAARARAEAELTALRRAIERVPGLRGRLLRWAGRGLGPR
jgi:septation ring formation regulator EzrA